MVLFLFVDPFGRPRPRFFGASPDGISVPVKTAPSAPLAAFAVLDVDLFFDPFGRPRRLTVAPSIALVTTCPFSIFASTALSVSSVEPDALSNLRLAVKPIDLASLVTIELKSAVGWVPADESLISYAITTPVAFCGVGM